MKQYKQSNTIKTPSKGASSFLEIAYVVIPQDVNRDDFVMRCLKNNVVTIKNEYGMIEKDVSVSENVMNLLKFPTSPYELGSAVYFGKILNHNSPAVIDVLPSKVQIGTHTGTEQFVLKRSSGNFYSSVLGDGAIGTLKLAASDSVYLSVNSGDTKGLLNIKNNGSTKLFSNDFFFSFTDFISVNTSDKESVEMLRVEKNKISFSDSSNSFSLTKDDGAKLLSKAVEIGDSSKLTPSVRGEDLNSNLKDLITQLNTLLTDLSQFAATQATAAAANTFTSPLAGGFTVLGTSVLNIQTTLTKISASLVNHLSKEVKIS